MTDPRLLRRYAQRLAESSDLVMRAVAAEQLSLLREKGCPVARTKNPAPRTPWRRVPLDALFQLFGNQIVRRGDGSTETSHRPVHASRSGRCVSLDLARGIWWCRSCRTGGAAPRFVMDSLSISYAEAAAWLSARWGSPERSDNSSRLTGLTLEAEVQP